MTYEKITATYAAANGQDTITYYFYIPTATPCAVLQIAHGMCEYVERYENFIQYWLALGICVCGNDHVGHGNSARDAEHLGYFGGKGGWKNAREDILTMSTIAKQRYPNLPLFLLGHSMGSFLTRSYISHYAENLAGVIISSTGNQPALLVNAGLAASHLMRLLCGDTYRSKLITNLVFGKYNARLPQPQATYAWLSRDEAVVEKYTADPLCNFSFTTDGYCNLLALIKSISSKKWYATVPPNLPVLLTAGTQDPVGHYGKDPQKIYAALLAAGVQDVTLKLYPDCRHELHNETNHLDYYADLANWLLAQISNSTK